MSKTKTETEVVGSGSTAQPDGTGDQGQSAVVTEEDLSKALKKLEGKETETAAAAPVVQTAQPDTSLTEKLAAEQTEELKKAMSAPAFSSMGTLVAGHVDQVIEMFGKSIQAAAERDMSVITVLDQLRKSIDENTETIKKYLDQPGQPASSKPVSVEGKEVLEKSTGAQTTKKEEMTTDEARTKVLEGLEKMAKSVEPTSPDFQEIAAATVMFNAAGKISQPMLKKALAASAKE